MSKPMFQRRHYEAVAAIVKGTRAIVGDLALRRRRHLAGEFADMFAADNPQFDRARFLKACGVDSSEGR